MKYTQSGNNFVDFCGAVVHSMGYDVICCKGSWNDNLRWKMTRELWLGVRFCCEDRRGVCWMEAGLFEDWTEAIVLDDKTGMKEKFCSLFKAIKFELARILRKIRSNLLEFQILENFGLHSKDHLDIHADRVKSNQMVENQPTNACK